MICYGRFLTFFLLLILFGCGTDTQISKSPALFGGFYDAETSHSYLIFKRDSTFEWFSGSALGASDSYQGKYLLRDSLIHLDKIGFNNVIKSNILLWTTVHPNPRGVNGNYLVQVDSLNRVVDSIFIFSVREYNRDTLK